MTRKEATAKLASLRPDRPVILGVERARYGWVAIGTEGIRYCLATGHAMLPAGEQAERFGGDER